VGGIEGWVSGAEDRMGLGRGAWVSGEVLNFIAREKEERKKHCKYTKKRGEALHNPPHLYIFLFFSPKKYKEWIGGRGRGLVALVKAWKRTGRGRAAVRVGAWKRTGPAVVRGVVKEAMACGRRRSGGGACTGEGGGKSRGGRVSVYARDREPKHCVLLHIQRPSA